MKKRPTIALACILKNEAHNIGPFLESISDCFDAIYMTDTGSTDNSLDILGSLQSKEVAGCPINVSHFDWVDDFAAARQYAFDQVDEKYDYIMWLDLDDALSDRSAFIHWRNHSMHVAHHWLANYKYAYDERGNCVCEFFRERVVKNNFGFKWKYFIHEGLLPDHNHKVDTQFIGAWTVNHRRTSMDEKNDRSRNIRIFEQKIKDGIELAPRMLYYYGKELFDAAQYLKALETLQAAAVLSPDSGLELHDRIMCQQYLSMAYARCGKWQHSLNVALNGLQLDASRAEYWVCTADALLNLGQRAQAKLFYEGAKHCATTSVNGALFSSPHARTLYPSQKLAEIYLGELNHVAAQKEITALMAGGVDVSELQKRASEMKLKDVAPKVEDLIPTEDIVISTPPRSIMGEWDEKLLETKGLGGSETAAVEVARLLKETTGRPVKVFVARKTADVMPSGVEYLPIDQLEEYFRKYLPHRHIAWRHCANLTPAPTYVWSHDLLTPQANHMNYEKLWCLTEFHKNLVIDLQGVRSDKIDLVRNGVDDSLFTDEVEKKPSKVIFSSSPDRGWKRTIEICKRARQEVPDLELHLFYGTGNMRAMGMIEQADELDNLVKENSDFVKYHGFVNKQSLVKHFQESAVWLYPADFIETSCITAMESLCAGAYPIVRNMGALKYTLGEAYEAGICDILDRDAVTDDDFNYWAEVLVKHIKEKSYKKVVVEKFDYSWRSRIKDYIKSMGL